MDDLKPYAIFAETVAAGSMSAAARRLGMTPSAVSQTLRTLEAHAGVTLLHRSTRKLSLTEAGERCYPHCLRLLEAARAAAESLAYARDTPSGELRVAAPVGFAAHIAAALAPLLAESTQLRLSLLLDDAMVDLIDARIDIAIRVGRLPDSTWIARRLCEIEMVLCAAPSYFERRRPPRSPRELIDHHWLVSARESATPSDLQFDLRGVGGERQRVRVDAHVASNNQLALQQMCEQGLGIARLAYPDVLPSLVRGVLTRVLPQWRFTPLPVTAVTPRRDGEAAKVRVAMQALKRYFATLPAVAPDERSRTQR